MADAEQGAEFPALARWAVGAAVSTARGTKLVPIALSKPSTVSEIPEKKGLLKRFFGRGRPPDRVEGLVTPRVVEVQVLSGALVESPAPAGFFRSGRGAGARAVAWLLVPNRGLG